VRILPEETACGSARNTASPWRVVRVREPWADDVPFEIGSKYLWPSGDRNAVRGPDSLTARVVIVARRGYVDIVNDRTGVSRRLLETPASLPQWSPDGRYVSCVVRKSRLAPYQLAVADVATSTVVVDSVLNASGTVSKWSPDSGSIIASGLMNGRGAAVLYRVSIPSGKVTVLDSVEVSSYHEFSWSPDGRWVAFSRPTRADGHYGTTAAELWLADAANGESWCVLDSPEWAEMNPLWITDRSLQVTRARWRDEGDSEEQRMVVELSHTADLRH
jgi:Tol biopolymer transport system component